MCEAFHRVRTPRMVRVADRDAMGSPFMPCPIGPGLSCAMDGPARSRFDQVAQDVASAWAWTGTTAGAWRQRTWTRRVAAWALVGVVGDAVTTSLLPHVAGVREANPVAAAGQELVGSVPLFMLATSIPLALAVCMLANRPANRAQWIIWASLAFAGAVKVAVTISNVAVLSLAITTETILRG